MNTRSVVPPQGSLFGGILLVTGCCIGAGMLGMPVYAAVAGFFPSLFILIAFWLFMATTGLLLLEVTLRFGAGANIVTMANKTLGSVGKMVAWGSFLYLFYSLMVTFVSGSGELISDFIFEILKVRLPALVCSFSLCVLFGVFLFLGTQAVDYFNRLLILGLLFSYALLVVTGFSYVKFANLFYHDWANAPLVIPTMIVSFGFHNLVPSLATYMHGDLRRLRLTILLGSAVPLVIYVVWMILLLGIVPVDGEDGFRHALNAGEMATTTLRQVVGNAWVTVAIHYLAFFSIVTTLLAVGLSFVDFLADGLGITKDARGKLLLCLLVLLPPYLFAAIYPHLFFAALNYAGGFGAVFLFGILPSLMVWAERYCRPSSAKHDNKPVVPGGKVVLVVVMAISLGVMGLQTIQLMKDLKVLE